MAKIDGIALAAVGAGGLFAYAGITGRSIPHALQAVVQGKSPQAVNPTLQISSAAPAGAAASEASGGSVLGGAPVSAGASEQAFFTAFLKDLSAPVTDANLQAMYKWAAKEEPAWPPQASGISWTWNPLNIKNPFGDFFASYPSPQAGAFATAGFLLANNYGAIVRSLRTGNGITDSPEVAAELSAFSGGGYTSVNSGGG